MSGRDRVALVTGASGGIGLATARALAADGYRVVTAQRRASGGLEWIAADFAEPDSPNRVIDEVMARAGRLDVLVNNAAIMLNGDALQTSDEDWARTLAINLTAPFLLIRRALPHLQAGASIVNIGSISGLEASPGLVAYCTAKAGLHGLTRSIAVDHGPAGIRCNAVAPGWIETELNEAYIASQSDADRFRERLARLHPLGRIGMPSEVAALVCWLASDDAAFVTGQTFTVDGGRTVQSSMP